MRNIDIGILEKLAEKSIRPFMLVEIDNGGAIYRYTDCDVPIWDGGYEYAPRGIELSSVSYSSNNIVDSAQLKISNLDDILTSAFVGGDPQGAKVNIKLVLLHADTYQIVGGPGTVTPDIIYTFEEINGNIIADKSGNGLDLTLVNSPTLTTENAAHGNALLLNPLGAELLTNGDFGTGDLTGWSQIGTPQTGDYLTVSSALEIIRAGNGIDQYGVESSTHAVASGEKYRLRADYNITEYVAGGVSLQAYDVTNGAEIDIASASGVSTGEFEIDFFVPATCTSISVRVFASADFNGTVYFDDVSLKKLPQNQYGSVSYDYGTVTKLSVSTWVYVDSFNQPTNGTAKRTPFVSDWNTFSVGAQKGFLLSAHNNGLDENQLVFNIGDGTNYYSTLFTPLSDNDFNALYAKKKLHLAGVFDGDAGFMRLYLNGDLIQEKTTGVPAQCVAESTTPIYIGRTDINQGKLNGTVDETRIEFGTAWTDVEVRGLYEASIQNGITIFLGTIDRWDLPEGELSLTVASEFQRWAQKTLANYSPSCRWKNFKGVRCGYAGAETWCNRTYTRCVALGNEANFGGFRWLPSIMGKDVWWGQVPGK